MNKMATTKILMKKGVKQIDWKKNQDRITTGGEYHLESDGRWYGKV